MSDFESGALKAQNQIKQQEAEKAQYDRIIKERMSTIKGKLEAWKRIKDSKCRIVLNSNLLTIISLDDVEIAEIMFIRYDMVCKSRILSQYVNPSPGFATDKIDDFTEKFGSMFVNIVDILKKNATIANKIGINMSNFSE